MADVEVVDALAREARHDVRALLFLLEDEREEALDGRGGHIVAVRALDEGLRDRDQGASAGILCSTRQLGGREGRTLPLRSRMATSETPGMVGARSDSSGRA